MIASTAPLVNLFNLNRLHTHNNTMACAFLYKKCTIATSVGERISRADLTSQYIFQPKSECLEAPVDSWLPTFATIYVTSSGINQSTSAN